MGFVVYDLAFLVLFTLGVVVFLHTRKHNLQRQGILYLYRTKLGIRFIEKFAKQFRSILRPMQYVVIGTGFVLMGTVIWLLFESLINYFRFFSVISSQTSSPPLVLLLPYTPKIFGLESFLPPLYFTSFIIMFLIIAVPHEFAHGIFARLNKFKIHSTGFAFLGPILGAFVEPDEKQMEKAKKFPHMAVLAAGTFANVLVVVLFGLIMTGFVAANFVPAGAGFNAYPRTVINLEGATLPEEIDDSTFVVEIEYEGETYLVSPNALKFALEQDLKEVVVWEDAPAARLQIRGAITELDGQKITNYEELSAAIKSHKPGDVVPLKTAVRDSIWDSSAEMVEYNVEFADREGMAFLGVGINSGDIPGVSRSMKTMNYFFEKATALDPLIYYESKSGDFGWFIYYLLWWIVFASAMVALINMLPLGIFDGGRFFYLTVWGLTGKESIGKKAFAISTWLILALLALMMIRWAIGFF